MPHRQLNITAENVFTAPILVRGGDTAAISISGSFSVTGTGIVLQRSFDGTANWRDVPNPDGSTGWTSAVEASYYADESSFLRLGVKTGNYGSGAALVRLGTDRAQPWQTWQDGVAMHGDGALGVFAAVAYRAAGSFGGGGALGANATAP